MGRPRKSSIVSNSTVATVDAELVSYTSETSVLKLPGPNDNDWDITFVLEDVAVYSKDGRMANLLSVAFDGPFTVRGLIKVEKDQKHRFLKPSMKSAYISITGCTRFSVGIGEDNRSPCIWAGGKCGWFEIRPPMPAYCPIYNKMNQAVSLYYFMQDVHNTYEEEQRKKKLKVRSRKPTRREIFATLDVDTMFIHYAVLVGDGAFREEVIAACDEHAPFLISQFFTDERLPKDQRVDWPPTTFYRWLTARHPDIVEKIRNAESGKKVDAPAPAGETNDLPSKKASPSKSQSAVGSSSNNNSDLADAEAESKDHAPTKRKTRRSRSTEQPQAKQDAHAPSPESSLADHPMSDVPEILESTETPLEDLSAAIALPTTTEDSVMEDATNQTPVQLLHGAVELLFREYTDPDKPPKPIQKLQYSWIRSHLYYRFRMANYETSNTLLEYFAADLLPLLDEAVWGPSEFYSRLRTLARTPNKSARPLQLHKVSHYLQRRAPASGSGSGSARNTSQKTLETPQSKPVGRPPGGKTSGLRPSTKRNISEVDTDTSSRGFKVPKTSHFFDDGIPEDSHSDIVEDSSDDEEETTETPVPLKVVLEVEKLTDLTPKGPNGAWVCDEDDDCAFVERNPEDAAGKARIREHIQEEHESQGQSEMISLAMMEGGRGHLPIDHLLEKIRKMGAKVEKDTDVLVNDNLLKKPVKRRLLI